MWPLGSGRVVPRGPGVRAEMTGLSVPQLRREARLRREYLYRKAREEAQRSAQERKEKVRRALEENRLIPTELRREALALQGSLEFDDAGGEGVTNHVDDEYRWAGVEDPKVMITTSRDPSSRLKMFAKVTSSGE